MNKNYTPQPIDVTNIELPAELMALAESIAENVHDVWAENRMRDGWTYGPKRNDEKKETPCLVGYNDLPESEKAYDRDTAFSTLKLIKALGWEIVPKKEMGESE